MNCSNDISGYSVALLGFSFHCYCYCYYSCFLFYQFSILELLQVGLGPSKLNLEQAEQIFYNPGCLPVTQPTVSKEWRHFYLSLLKWFYLIILFWELLTKIQSLRNSQVFGYRCASWNTRCWTGVKSLTSFVILLLYLLQLCACVACELALTAVDGKMIVVGGMSTDSNPKDYLMQYDAEKDVWKSLPSMPTARYATSSFLIHDKLYVLGRLCTRHVVLHICGSCSSSIGSEYKCSTHRRMQVSGSDWLF